jgi:SAM-dependent methyltransferase
VSEPTAVAATSAALHGPRWGARAADWAQLSAGMSAPAWKAIADATAIGSGTRVLDIACGSGEFCRLAADRGAEVSGIEAAAGMIDVARRLAPDADLRVGAMESLPWDDDNFDVVTGFNAFQFAADLVAALAEAKRVARAGGQVAICNWGRPEDCELFAVMGSLCELQPPPRAGSPSAGPPAIGEPGVLEALAHRVGLDMVRGGEVAVPFEAPDQETLVRALLAPGAVAPAIEHSGEDAVRRTIVRSAEPFKRPDGSYQLENKFRYVISQRPASAGR